MDHPDFRVSGKIFATLGYPEKGWAMVKLPPEEQHNFVQAYAGVFVPVKGTWGLRGATSVRLKAAHQTVAHRALAAAWRNAAPKGVVARFDSAPSA